MKYVIIGTAGHVDHGKTALIYALTGIDTDRLKEEKQRGISIDLGFAALTLGGHIHAGIVDVPGHERFLKNMLAGTGGLDLVMLVIAADEGVMPQTREHLAMLELYGLKRGVVVITKCDKVDDEWLAMLDEDIASFLTGTFLAKAPVCHVSAVTGQGLDLLQDRLRELAAQVPARNTAAPFRMWIDRAFSARGHGAVVTGTVLSGAAAIGDALALYPAGKTVKIRGLETHGVKQQRIYAGQRAAINLTGAELAELKRGMALSDPLRGQISRYWDVAAEWRQAVDKECRIRLHLGTGEYIGRIYQPQKAPPGQYRLALEQPLPAGAGDRGILRLYSPQYLLGGVVLLGAVSEKAKIYPDRRPVKEAALTANGKQMVEAILACQQAPLTVEELKRQAGYLPDALVAAGLKTLVDSRMAVNLGRFYMTAQWLAAMTGKLLKTLADYHQVNANRLGMPKEELRQRLLLDNSVFELLLSHLGQTGQVHVDGAEAALPEHAAKHQGWRANLAGEAEQLFADVGLTIVDAAYIAGKKGISLAQAQKYLEALVKEGIVLRMGEIHVYRKTIQYIVEVIQRHFRLKPTLTVAELRDLLNTSRKFALPVLEYLDMHKYTVRSGDMRQPGPRLGNLSE